MIHRYLILIMLLISQSAALSQDDESTYYVEDTTLILLDSIDNDAILLTLFENDEIQIFTTYQLFKNHMEKWIEAHPHIQSDKELLQRVKLRAEVKDPINVFELAENFNLSSRLKYRLADMLDEGNCLILDNKRNYIVDKIVRQTYSYYCGELCAEEGRIYFYNDTKFLKVIDLIS